LTTMVRKGRYMYVVGTTVTLTVFGLFTVLLIALSISEAKRERQAREGPQEVSRAQNAA